MSSNLKNSKRWKNATSLFLDKARRRQREDRRLGKLRVYASQRVKRTVEWLPCVAFITVLRAVTEPDMSRLFVGKKVGKA